MKTASRRTHSTLRIFQNGLLALLIGFAGTAHATLPDCDDAPLSHAQIQSAVDLATDQIGVENFEWSRVALAAADILGCNITGDYDGISSDGFDPLSVTTEGRQPNDVCQDAFCPSVKYCGFGDSTNHPYLTMKTSGNSINQACFNHDRCYDRVVSDNCDAPISLQCIFAPNNEPVRQCDVSLIAACDKREGYNDDLICTVVEKRVVLHNLHPLASCEDTGVEPLLIGPFTGTYQWDCGGGSSGSTPITLALTQNSETGLLGGTVSHSGSVLPIQGYRGCNLIGEGGTLPILDRTSPRGRAFVFTYDGDDSVTWNFFSGHLQPNRIGAPFDYMYGQTLNGDSPTGGFIGCSAAVGPSGSFNASPSP